MGWKRKVLEAMGDDELYDFHLVGTDGEEVPCCKTDLARISPVFKSMFFRGFREQNSNRCNLNFHSVVISLVVKYCCCGEVDMDLIFGKNRPLREEASLLVGVREAGRFFEIEELSVAAAAKMGEVVFENTDSKRYYFASAFLMGLFKHGEDEGPLWRPIYRFTVDNAMKCFGPRAPESDSSDSYCHANPKLLCRVLKKAKDTYAVVRCIQTWVSLDSNIDKKSFSDEEKQSLLELAKNIDLKSLKTSELANIQPCSLFSSERILEAFVHHCKKSDEENTSETATTKRGVMYVSGAEMKYLNGYYTETWCSKDGTMLGIFRRKVEHDGKTCWAAVHRRNKERKWYISIVDFSYWYDIVNSGCEVGDQFIKVHVYKSSFRSLPAEDQKLPPFDGWRCVEGNGAVPFVACNMKKT